MDYLQQSAAENMTIAVLSTIVIMGIGYFIYWFAVADGYEKLARSSGAQRSTRWMFSESTVRQIRFFWLTLYFYLGYLIWGPLYRGDFGLLSVAIFFFGIPIYIGLFWLFRVRWEKYGEVARIAVVVVSTYVFVAITLGILGDYNAGYTDSIQSPIGLYDLIIVALIYVGLMLLNNAAPRVLNQGYVNKTRSTPSPQDDVAQGDPQTDQSTPVDNPTASSMHHQLGHNAESVQPVDRQSTSPIRKPSFFYIGWIVLSAGVIIAFFDTVLYSAGKPSPGQAEMVASAATRGITVAVMVLFLQLFLSWLYRDQKGHKLWWVMTALPVLGVIMLLITEPTSLSLLALYVFFVPIIVLLISVKGIIHLLSRRNRTD